MSPLPIPCCHHPGPQPSHPVVGLEMAGLSLKIAAGDGARQRRGWCDTVWRLLRMLRWIAWASSELGLSEASCAACLLIGTDKHPPNFCASTSGVPHGAVCGCCSGSIMALGTMCGTTAPTTNPVSSWQLRGVHAAKHLSSSLPTPWKSPRPLALRPPRGFTNSENFFFSSFGAELSLPRRL